MNDRARLFHLVDTLHSVVLLLKKIRFAHKSHFFVHKPRLIPFGSDMLLVHIIEIQVHLHGDVVLLCRIHCGVLPWNPNIQLVPTREAINRLAKCLLRALTSVGLDRAICFGVAGGISELRELRRRSENTACVVWLVLTVCDQRRHREFLMSLTYRFETILGHCGILGRVHSAQVPLLSGIRPAVIFCGPFWNY